MPKRGLLTTPAYVIDVRFSDLPPDYDPTQYTLTLTDVFGAIPASHQPVHPSEAAVQGAFAPGGHTAIVRGVGDGTGVGLVEVFVAP